MRWLILAVVIGCGGHDKPFEQQTRIGAACDPTGTSERPPDCADPLICTDVFGTGTECMNLHWGACPTGTKAHSTSVSPVCMPVCGSSDCQSGWGCQADGVCAPH